MKRPSNLEISRALVATGLILYIPANTIPVMTMTVVGDVEPLTVLGGVQELADSGLLPVAGIVFFASIVIPLAKLTALLWIHFLHGTTHAQPQRMTVYRLIHQIGTWSMIDIFLLSVLAAVGQLGILASVRAEPGCLFFAAVLVATLFATSFYHPQYIWQPAAIAEEGRQ